MTDAGPSPNLVRLAWSQAALFVVGCGIFVVWSRATNDNIRSAFLYVGLTLGQMVVASTWLMLGVDSFVRRILAAVGVWLITLGAWYSGDLQNHTPLSHILPIQVKICGGMGLLLLIPLAVMRRFGRRMGRRCASRSGTFQFGLRDLLALTAAAGVVLGVLRVGAFTADWSEPEPLWQLFATAVGGAFLVALALLGAACIGRRRVVLLAALVAPPCVSALEARLLAGPSWRYNDAVAFFVLNAAVAAVVLTHGYAARWAGFSLVRQGAG